MRLIEVIMQKIWLFATFVGIIFTLREVSLKMRECFIWGFGVRRMAEATETVVVCSVLSSGSPPPPLSVLWPSFSSCPGRGLLLSMCRVGSVRCSRQGLLLWFYQHQ